MQNWFELSDCRIQLQTFLLMIKWLFVFMDQPALHYWRARSSNPCINTRSTSAEVPHWNQSFICKKILQPVFPNWPAMFNLRTGYPFPVCCVVRICALLHLVRGYCSEYKLYAIARIGHIFKYLQLLPVKIAPAGLKYGITLCSGHGFFSNWLPQYFSGRASPAMKLWI